MIEGDFLVLFAMLIYFIVVLTIGFVYAKRSNSSTSEYFIGGRKVGPWLTALSAEASDMSGYLLMGLPGLAYWCGASDAGWTAIGLAIGTYLNWKLVARRLRMYSVKAGDAITLPGFYSKRFHDDKNILSTVSALIILVFFCVYTGSCFVTCGKLFNTLFGLDYLTMMALGAIIVFLYTLIGGYLSVVATDFVQGCLMFFALAVVVIGSICQAGGVENVAAVLQDIPGFLSAVQTASPEVVDIEAKNPVQAMTGTQPLFGVPSEYGVFAIISTMAWGLGYFGMPQVLVRFMGIRSAKEIKQSRIIAVVWVVVSLFCAICIGLIGRAILMTSPDVAAEYAEFLAPKTMTENIFIVLSKVMLPSFLCGVVVSGILAAAMSSSSSYLLIAGSSVAENIFRGVIKRDATDNQVMIVARITLIVVFLFGVWVASDQDSTIFDVVSYAWAGLGASFGPLTLCCLYWRRTTKWGGLAGMIAGTVVVIVWHTWLTPLVPEHPELWFFGMYELLPAFIISLLCIVVVSLIDKEPSAEIQEEFDHYMDTSPEIEARAAANSEEVERTAAQALGE